MNPHKTYNKAILIILDGFGLPTANNTLGNAIQEAKTPTFDHLLHNYPNTILHTSGKHVGLNEGQMGNSEIGHLNLGSGRIIYSDILRIHKALDDQSFIQNSVLTSTLKNNRTKKIHLLGLLSDGGVHSHIDHLKKMVLLLKKQYSDFHCYLHAFLDGRDTAPTSGLHYITDIQNYFKELNYGELVSVIGRYYAMDRDNRWDRTQKAYDLLTKAKAHKSKDIQKTIQKYYAKNITDEFMEPISLNSNITINKKDIALFFNFRADRARQLTEVFTSQSFNEFHAPIKNADWLCLTEYKKVFQNKVLFPQIAINNLLGEVISQHELSQLRLAETEKYAHVTFFFNGGVEKAYHKEERILVNSPKVDTYDLQPTMSAGEVKNHLLEAIKQNKHHLIIVNFANGDMVGHTGDLQATIKAVECLDHCMSEILSAQQHSNYSLFITADHGNCEQMLAEDKETPFTQHTTLPVPLILVPTSNSPSIKLQQEGKLADVAPTLLKWMALPIPKDMTGNILLTQ